MLRQAPTQLQLTAADVAELDNIRKNVRDGTVKDDKQQPMEVSAAERQAFKERQTRSFSQRLGIHK